MVEKVYFQNNLASQIKLFCFENKLNVSVLDFSIYDSNIGFGSKRDIDEKLGIDIKRIINKIKDL